nr:hypothetical protein [Flexivirga aerilata]
MRRPRRRRGQHPGGGELFDPPAQLRVAPAVGHGVAQRGIGRPAVPQQLAQHRLVGRGERRGATVAHDGRREQRRLLLGGQQAAADPPVPDRPAAEDVQHAIRGDGVDLRGAGQLAQQQVVALLRAPRPEDAHHLGAAGEQRDPVHVVAAGERPGDLFGGVRAAGEAQAPVLLAERGRINQAHHPHGPGLAQPPVATRDRLLRHAQHAADQRERHARRHLQAVGDPGVEIVGDGGSVG